MPFAEVADRTKVRPVQCRDRLEIEPLLAPTGNLPRGIHASAVSIEQQRYHHRRVVALRHPAMESSRRPAVQQISRTGSIARKLIRRCDPVAWRWPADCAFCTRLQQTDMCHKNGSALCPRNTPEAHNTDTSAKVEREGQGSWRSGNLR